MTAEEIQAKLHTLIQPYVEDKSLLDAVKPETDLLQDLHINSAHLVDIILDAEDAFGIEIDDDSAEQMLTLGAAVGVIQQAIQAQKSE